MKIDIELRNRIIKEYNSIKDLINPKWICYELRKYFSFLSEKEIEEVIKGSVQE